MPLTEKELKAVENAAIYGVDHRLSRAAAVNKLVNELRLLRAVAEDAARELLHIDAHMNERVGAAEKVMKALGLPWPPNNGKHDWGGDGCKNCGCQDDDEAAAEPCDADPARNKR